MDNHLEIDFCFSFFGFVCLLHKYFSLFRPVFFFFCLLTNFQLLWLCRKLSSVGNGQRMVWDLCWVRVGVRVWVRVQVASDSISTWVNINVPDAPLKFKRAIHFHLIFNAFLVFFIAFPLRFSYLFFFVVDTSFVHWFLWFLSFPFFVLYTLYRVINGRGSKYK